MGGVLEWARLSEEEKRPWRTGYSTRAYMTWREQRRREAGEARLKKYDRTNTPPPPAG